MFISKETLAAYLVIPLLSSSIFVNAKCLHTDGVRIKKNDRCFVGKFMIQGNNMGSNSSIQLPALRRVRARIYLVTKYPYTIQMAVGPPLQIL